MPIKYYKRKVGKKPGDVKQAQWSDKQKFDTVAAYMVIGNIKATAEATGVPPDTIKYWKAQEWWKDYEGQIRQQTRVQVSGKLLKVIEKAFKVVEDRLENGDWLFNSRTGEIRRVGVSAKTAGDILHKSIDRQVVLEKIQSEPEMKEEAIIDRLKSIEQRLIQASKIRPKAQVIDVEPEQIKEEDEENVTDNPT